jgi:hypothetical protein
VAVGRQAVDLRRDPLSGRVAVVAPRRRRRPGGGAGISHSGSHRERKRVRQPLLAPTSDAEVTLSVEPSFRHAQASIPNRLLPARFDSRPSVASACLRRSVVSRAFACASTRCGRVSSLREEGVDAPLSLGWGMAFLEPVGCVNSVRRVDLALCREIGIVDRLACERVIGAAGNVIGIADGFQSRDGRVRSSVVHGSTKAERRAARERVSNYYDAELAKLVEQVEQAIARYRVGEIDVHDVDEVIRRYARAARELWKFCWSGGSGSHLVFVARTLELWGRRSGSGRLVGRSGEAWQAPLTRA